MNQEFVEADIFPFFESFNKGPERNKIKAHLSMKLGYDVVNLHKKLEGTTARCLSDIEKEGVILFYYREYKDRVLEYLAKKER